MMQFTRPETDLAKFPLVFIRVGLRAEQRRNIRYRKHYSNPPASHRSLFPNRRLTDKSLLLFVPAGVEECSSVNFKANILHRKSHSRACNSHRRSPCSAQVNKHQLFLDFNVFA